MDKQSQEEGLNEAGENPEVPPLLNEDDAPELPPILKGKASMPSSEAVASQVPDASEPETPVPRSNSPVAEPVTASVQPSIFVRAWTGFYAAIGWCFGLVCLIAGLAVVAAIPLVNLVGLGYLLFACGHIASTGRFRDGFVGVRRAGRLGGAILGVWLVLWPARMLASLRDSAMVVSPEKAGFWIVALWVVTGITILHIAWALIRGGKLRHFVWPAPIRLFFWLGESNKFATARDALWKTVAGLQLPRLFWLGARGFAGTVLWLILPVGLMVLASLIPHNAGILVSLLGALLMMFVVLLLPFLQVWFAKEGRMRAFVEVWPVLKLMGRSPFRCWIALALTLTSSLPLFLLKVELTPAEITWLPALFFVVFGLPARLIAGWAMGRAISHEPLKSGWTRWLSRVAALALAVPFIFVYVLILFFSQFISWNGTLSLLEQHAFLIPSPF